jgi:triacylglycerol lipase
MFYTLAMTVFLVHGIWDDERSLAPLARTLRTPGGPRIVPVRLTPSTGSVPLLALAEQVKDRVERECPGHERVDIVGFSMGALVTRTYLQLLDGTRRVRRFVSISGPHRGTVMAYGLGLAGVRDMRPNSALLRRLGDDVSGLVDTEVHCIYTPYDVLVTPPTTAVLRGAKSVHRVHVPVHGLMLRAPSVQRLVRQLVEFAHEADDLRTDPAVR